MVSLVMSSLGIGRVTVGAVYESNMSIESYIESGRLSHATTPIPDRFFGTFDTGGFFGQPECWEQLKSFALKGYLFHSQKKTISSIDISAGLLLQCPEI